MKLFYFDFAGRAENCRIMLRAAGHDFEDVRFSRDEWVSTYKQMSPTGQCPFLLCDDGSYLAQSLAIEAYVSGLTGFTPEDPLAAAKGWMLYECYREAWGALAPTMKIENEDEKIAARKALMAEGGAAHQMLNVIEKHLAERSAEFAVADRPTVVDVCVYQNVNFLLSGRFDGLDRESLAPFPKLVELMGKVAEHPTVAKGIAK